MRVAREAKKMRQIKLLGNQFFPLLSESNSNQGYFYAEWDLKLYFPQNIIAITVDRLFPVDQLAIEIQ